MQPASELIRQLQKLPDEALERLSDEELASVYWLLEQARRDRLDEICSTDPLWWAQNLTKTENPHYQQQGLPFVAAFPKKSYFEPLFQYLASERRIFIPKTREMMTSWAVVVYATHCAQWKGAEIIVQTASEEKVRRLCEYGQILYRNQPDWLKSRHPLKRDPSALAMEWRAGGKLFGIPSGEDKIRMFHPTVYVMDEAAFLPEAEACYNAAQPVCQQIIAVSSVGIGWFSDQCSR